MDGFGAADAWSMDPIGREWSAENCDRLADLLFRPDRGAGLSRWRFNIGAGGKWTDELWDPWRGAECFRRGAAAPLDWSQQAGQQRFLEAAMRRGVRHYTACVYSPPTWLTRNGHAHCGGVTGSSNLGEGRERDFSRFLADVLDHFIRTKHIPFRTLSPLNEPNWDWDGGQEGCRYSVEDMKRLIRALHEELHRRGLAVELDLPESGDLGSMLDDATYRRLVGSEDPGATYRGGAERRGHKSREYVGEFLGSSDFRRCLSGCVVGHSYWTDSGPRMIQIRRSLRGDIDRHAPGGRYAMGEYCVMEHKRDLGMDMALRVARVIHADIVEAGAARWDWWLAVSPADYKDGLVYTDYRAGGGQNIIESRTLWALAHWSRYVRPGARRVEAALSADSALDVSLNEAEVWPSAFVAPGGEQLVAVIVNQSRERRSVRSLVDRPVREVGAIVTSAAAAMAEAPVLTGGRVDLPPRSITTLRFRLG